MLRIADRPSSAVANASEPIPKPVRPATISRARRWWSSMTSTRIGTVHPVIPAQAGIQGRLLPNLQFAAPGSPLSRGRTHPASQPPPDLGGERHTAGAAAGARGGDQDSLLLLLVEVGAVEHGPDLLLKQIMQREIARAEAVGGGGRATPHGRLPPRGARGRRRRSSACALGQGLILPSYDVDHTVEIAAQEARHVVLDGGQRALRIDVEKAAEMRRDQDVLARPERMVVRQ